MINYRSETRWVDTSALVRFSGSSNLVNWQASVGSDVPFQYDNVQGIIHIVDVCRRQNGRGFKVCITIDNYVDDPITMSTHSILRCSITHLVERRIADLRPDLVKFLTDKKDAYKYSICSEKQICVTCPVCGYTKKVHVCDLTKFGFRCDICDDGISYPEKFISNVLQQAYIPFKREVSSSDEGFEWCNKFRYDFYFEHDQKKYFVEADGGFHRNQQQQDVDKKKDELAKMHDICMIRIPCDYDSEDRYLYLKHHVINSELNQLIDFNIIDWDQCNEHALSNLLFQVCYTWETRDVTQYEIADELKLDLTTVYKYLKTGAKIGLCPSYNRVSSLERYRQAVICYRNNEMVHAFRTATVAANELTKLYGRVFKKDFIIRVCQGYWKNYRGLQMKYVSKQEYEQYKMINNNEVVLKEAII